MIDAALQFLVSELNTFMLQRTGTAFGSADLRRLVDDAGKTAVPEDRIGVCLINLDEEHSLKGQRPQPIMVNGLQVFLEPALRLNLHVIFAANFRQYDQAVRQLSLVLTFFQSHRNFDRDSYPGLDLRIEKMAVELESLGLDQINQIWSFVGGKQLPSVVYRVRVLALQDLEPASVGPPILSITSNLHDK